MTFLSVYPRDGGTTYNLPVISDSIEVVPDMDLNITNLNRKDDGTRYKHFFSNGFGGITFKCSLYLKRGELITELHKWFKESKVLLVSTDAIDIQLFNGGDEGAYIITKNASRKQDKEYTIWELEFTSYSELTLWKFKNDNSNVKAALNRAKKAKAKSNAKAKTALATSLKKCYIVNLKFSKKKKEVECVKILQKVLKKNGCYINGKIDGWYGEDTRGAVGGFQFTNKLKVTGKVDLKTFQKLVISVGG